MLRILVVALDPIIGGLIRELIALLGDTPVESAAVESGVADLYRLSPDAVLVDADHAAASYEPFLIEARRVRAPAIRFSGVRSAAELRSLALRRQASYFALPGGPIKLAHTIADARAVLEAFAATPPDARVTQWTRLVAHTRRHYGDARPLARSIKYSPPAGIGPFIAVSGTKRIKCRTPRARRGSICARK